MPHSRGLQFCKLDLHVHTPASSDYKDSGVTADQIVQRALDQGLSAIAVTDHQTAGMVDAVKAAAAGKDLAVFPGVELMVVGGEHGVHINLLFDINRDANFIHQFLNTVKVYNHDGKPTVASELTVGQVADQLWAYDPSAIMILAHCHSSKGVTGDIKGETRTQIFHPRRLNILGAEASESNFLDATKRANKQRVIDVFDGTNKDYHFRRLGVFQASDAHTLSEIGTAFSWFKVDAPITIEDLRQCLIDRDTRIRQPYEFKPIQYPRIDWMQVSSGFLKDQQVEFHEGLNSLLGAKGSGKSLAVEFLRFALGQQPQLSPIKEDHLAKLEKCLKPFGSVTVQIVDESGKQYGVVRTFNSAEGDPTDIFDLNDGSKKQFSVAEIFPVLFLSQNEIIRIAEDQSGASLRQFVDRFFDFHHHQYAVDAAIKGLQVADRKIAEALRAHKRHQETTNKANTIREEIERLRRQLTNPTFEKYSQAEAVGRAIRHHLDFVADLANVVTGLEEVHGDQRIPSGDGIDVDDPAVKRAADVAGRALKTVRDQFGTLKGQISQLLQEVQEEHKQWQIESAAIRADYEKLVKDTGGSQAALDQRRRKLVTDLTALERQLTADESKASALRGAAAERQQALDALEGAYKAYFDERSRRCEFFTEQSRGAIQVTIAEGRDVSEFRSRLLNIKRGTYLHEPDIDLIVQRVSPRALVGAALSFEVKGRTDSRPIQDLSASSGVKFDVLQRLITHMVEQMDYEQLLGLLYETAPQDVPQISYKVGDEFKPLSDLSVGQKAAALLIVGLSDGRFPIVIDQPEDSLDLRSIWDDICSTLRDAKDRRQFVFTTHNSSVAVASDSDKFTILLAGASQAKVLHSGSLNSSHVRAEVIAYLEGGPDTYEKKRAKYNL